MIKLAILGTRGIPNRYGGFERFAEVLSLELSKRDYQISVLKPVNKKEEPTISGNNLKVIPITIPAYLPRNIQTLLYDLKSLIWFSNSKFDLALECGHSFAIWLPFFKKLAVTKIVVNVDGLEHKRSKWGLVGKLFLKITEYLSIKYCARVISDHPRIAQYVFNKYKVESTYIPYGTYIPLKLSGKDSLKYYKLTEKKFHLVIARITPENSLDVVLKSATSFNYPTVVIGEISDNYGLKIYKKYNKESKIIFINGLYDQNVLNELRYNCCTYIHGHSVGGTNPSLLEAMACGCIIIAHNNPFNRYVLEPNGNYFTCEQDLVEQVSGLENNQREKNLTFKSSFIKRLEEEYSWEKVAIKYHQVFLSMI